MHSVIWPIIIPIRVPVTYFSCSVIDFQAVEIITSQATRWLFKGHLRINQPNVCSFSTHACTQSVLFCNLGEKKALLMLLRWLMASLWCQVVLCKDPAGKGRGDAQQTAPGRGLPHHRERKYTRGLFPFRKVRPLQITHIPHKHTPTQTSLYQGCSCVLSLFLI